MRFILDKREKRSREEGKETQFHVNGLLLSDEKIRKFGKRKRMAADISYLVEDPGKLKVEFK